MKCHIYIYLIPGTYLGLFFFLLHFVPFFLVSCYFFNDLAAFRGVRMPSERPQATAFLVAPLDTMT